MMSIARFLHACMAASAVLSLVAGAACQSSAASLENPQAAEATSVEAATDSGTPSAVKAEPIATPDAAAAAIITAVAIQSVPTPRALPRAVASPVALATPVPPSQAVGAAATDLDQKLTALSAALKTQDVNGALKLQRQLLASCDAAETALKNDKSTQAQAIRAAIADIRSSATGGDSNGYDHAGAALRQIVGGGTGLGFSVTSQGPGTDAVSDLHTLADQVRGLRQAVQNRNSGEALRLQAMLMGELDAAQKAVEKDETDQGKATKAALSDLQKGLDGDATRLASASATLDKLAGPTIGTASTPQGIDYAQEAITLASKVDAFRVAASTNSKSDLLRLQTDILAQVDQDSAALALDTADASPTKLAMKQALADLRNGVSGDLTKLDGARANLSKAAGQDTAAATVPGAGDANKPISDLSKFAADVDNTITSFQVALQKNDTGSMLRLRKQLSDQASQVDVGLKDSQSKPATEVRSAVDSIRTAFAGDLTKLDEAHVHLRNVTGTAPGAAQNGTTSTSTANKNVDVTGLGMTLKDKSAGLAIAVRDHQTVDEVNARREALKAAAAQAESSLTGVTDPRADRLRSAIGMAREAAGGDDAKAASAQAAIEAALNAQ